MNECQRIHETIVRDVYDVINNVKDFDEVEWVRSRNNTGSIARRASNLIVVFPVIVSTSLSIQTASVISKAIERKCVSLLQILFSSIQLTDVDNLYDYLKQFHTNLDLRAGYTLDDVISAVDTLANEGAITITDYDAYEAVKEDMHNINFYLDTEYNGRAISDFTVTKNMYGESAVVLNEKTWSFGPGQNYKNAQQASSYFNYAAKQQKGQQPPVNPLLPPQQPPAAGSGGVIPPITPPPVTQTPQTPPTGNAGGNGNGNGGGHRSSSGGSSRDRHPSLGGTKDMTDYFRYQLSQSDIDKANELMPTTMIVNFISRGENGSQPVQVSGVIGVKAKLYPVDSMDIVSRISSKYKDTNGLFNLVRASTREISFFRDLAFAVDKAKLDAINMAKESNNARMFKLLERRAAKNKFSTLLKKNDASPITSLVMSQEEVEYLKKYASMDMEKSFIARSILDKYNLMDIVIADEALETAKFLFDDGDSIFEVLTFDALEKSAKDSSYKKVINLMSKLNR